MNDQIRWVTDGIENNDKIWHDGISGRQDSAVPSLSSSYRRRRFMSFHFIVKAKTYSWCRPSTLIEPYQGHQGPERLEHAP